MVAKTHGEAGGIGKRMSVEYQAWAKMKRRAFNPVLKDQPYYGSGVGMDPRWQDYLTFIADVGRRPSPGHTFDRKDVIRGYWPDNCRWATHQERRNKPCGPKQIADILTPQEASRAPKRECEHGHSVKSSGRPSPEYRSWSAMRARCKYPSTNDYARYGGRGIRVCDRWDSFEAFLHDMGPKPAPNFWIGRLDSDGHYEPGNCEWQSPSQQRRAPVSSVSVPAASE